MKSIKFKKIAASVVAIATIVSTLPIGVSATWKQNSDNTWVYTEGESIATGWRIIDGKWYNFDNSGNMKTGWINDGGTWYYTSPDGGMKTGWINDNGTWYYAESSGAMKTGWVNDNETWYYTATNGAMQTSVTEIDKKIYSLSTNGSMQIGNIIINGETYTFSQNGECIGDKMPQPTKAFVGAGVTTAITEKKSSEVAQDNTIINSNSNSSRSSKHHSSSSSSDSIQNISKLTINNNDISFDYSINKNVNYDIKCEIYDEKDKMIDTVKWEKADSENNSKYSIFITDVLGEMNANNYIIAKISPNAGNGATIKSNKMKVISSNKMDKDISNINVDTKKINDKYQFTLTGKDNFENGTYVLYGFENEDSAYIKAVYCNGNTKSLEFNDLNSKWINTGVSKLKLARIYDAKQENDGSATCKVEFTDKFNF